MSDDRPATASSPAVSAAEKRVVRVSRVVLDVAGDDVRVANDRYSNRLRCDHPPEVDGLALGETLLSEAERLGRGRVVVLSAEPVAEGLRQAGFAEEGVIPGFYGGEDDCIVLGAYPEAERGALAAPARVEEVQRIVSERADAIPSQGGPIETRLANAEDAPALADLLGDTFAAYPTPSSDPAYIENAITLGTPFRVVEDDGEIVACASADLVPHARTAELTDCATRPSHRGRGYMRAILRGLVDDLRAMGYPTAFTLARANIVGVNLAFARLGFELRGTMPRSCRIGEGLEDMNIWSRAIEPTDAPVDVTRDRSREPEPSRAAQ